MESMFYPLGDASHVVNQGWVDEWGRFDLWELAGLQ
jgi:hypothetical protein